MSKKNAPWIASLYFFQSIPYVVVTLISTIMYQQYGMSNVKIAFLTSLMILPWSIKPLFSPLLEQRLTKKQLTLIAQGLVTLVFLVFSFSVHSDYFLTLSILGFTALALVSSVHDITSDGVYLLSLTDDEQKKYVALRSFFYQMGRLIIKGGLLVLVGLMAEKYQLNSWNLFFLILFMMSLSLTVFHIFKIPSIKNNPIPIDADYFSVFKHILSSWKSYPALLFIFLYNFSEGQLQKIVPIFMLDEHGLHLPISSVGEVYGLSGTFVLMLGIFISGIFLSRYSLTSCLKKFTLLTLFSQGLFLALSSVHNSYLIYVIILVSQFTFGLANGAYMGYLLAVSNQNQFTMSFYTLCTATMALSYVIFGALSGLMQQWLGYSLFFVYISLGNCLIILLTYFMMNKHDQLAR